jgi:hypothetical protein
MAGSGRVLLVSSSGGVLLDLLALQPWWSQHDVVWAAVPRVDTRCALHGQRVHWLHDVSLRHPLSVGVGLLQARRILARERPEVVISAGAGPALPFFVLARLRGITTFWVWTLNLLTSPGLSGAIASRLASRVLVQQPASLECIRNAILIGELY